MYVFWRDQFVRGWFPHWLQLSPHELSHGIITPLLTHTHTHTRLLSTHEMVHDEEASVLPFLLTRTHVHTPHAYNYTHTHTHTPSSMEPTSLQNSLSTEEHGTCCKHTHTHLLIPVGTIFMCIRTQIPHSHRSWEMSNFIKSTYLGGHFEVVLFELVGLELEGAETVLLLGLLESKCFCRLHALLNDSNTKYKPLNSKLSHRQPVYE